MQKRIRKNEGSILLIVMAFLMGLALIMYSSLRTISYFISLVREREKSEQYYYYAYALKQFIIHNYSDRITKSPLSDKHVLFSGNWPNKESGYKGYAWLKNKKGTKRLYIELEKNKKRVITLSFIV
jgi:hypothetical protein